jgi:hypothetical protein
MADLKISELPAADALDGDELVPVVQDSATKRTTAQAIANLGKQFEMAVGRVTGSNGDLEASIGIASVVHNETGVYAVLWEVGYFTEEFISNPVVVVSPDYELVPVIACWDGSLSGDGTTVRIFDLAGAPIDASFSIHAIAARAPE